MSSFQGEAVPSLSDDGLWLLVILSWLVKLLMFAFWIVVGWRVLRAHERIPKDLAAILLASRATAPSSERPAQPQA
jgi:hypothetical protein